MGRPVERTEEVAGGVMEVVKSTFGSRSNAYRNLGLAGRVEPAMFHRAWYGQTVRPGTGRAIEQAVDGWLAAMVARVRATRVA